MMVSTKKCITVVLSLVLLAQDAFGNNFPPVNNPPPVPGQNVRALDIPQPRYYIREDIDQEPPQPSVRDDDFFITDIKPDDQRWFFQENDSSENGGISRSTETSDRFYSNGEPAVGPVATPLPDDTYVAQQTSISNVNPNDVTNIGSSDIIILTRGPDNQYIPERWVRIETPAERVIEVINEDIGSQTAADTLKSMTAPLLPAPVQKQLTLPAPASLAQQVWVRASTLGNTQKVTPNSAIVIQDIPPVKQVADVPPTEVIQVVQQQVTKNLPPIPPPPTLNAVPVVPPKPFSVPPPPPPPLKGGDVVSKVTSPISIPMLPDPTVINPSKTEALQPLRHIWIPTSPRTGKFVSIPVPRIVESGKSITTNGAAVVSAPVTVSDTWVLKQGPIPTFKSQKSIPPPQSLQNGKIVIQGDPNIQVVSPPNTPVLTQFDSPKNSVGKSVGLNNPVDIWPVRKPVANPNISSKTLSGPGAALLITVPDLGTRTSKSITDPLVMPQKSITGNPNFSVFPSQLPPLATSVLNGKPCPIPLQRVLFPPRSATPVRPSRIIATQGKQPHSSIIRLNRYPSGTYYLLNSRFRPNIFTYPSPALIQPYGSRLVRVIQSQQIPIPLQNQQSAIPVQTKQISIPVQSKAALPVPNRQIAFAVPSRQIITPLSSLSSKITNPYTPLQIRYPWDSFMKSSPVPGTSVLGNVLLSPLKVSPLIPSPDLSSLDRSESSSESSSDEENENVSTEESISSKEEKKKKPENQTEQKSAKTTSESEESTSESKESIQSEESQMTFQTVQKAAISNEGVKITQPRTFRFDFRDEPNIKNPDEFFRLTKYFVNNEDLMIKLKNDKPSNVAEENSHMNFISNKAMDVAENVKIETETAKIETSATSV